MITAYISKWSDLEPVRIDAVQSWYIKEGALVIHHGREHTYGPQRYDQQVFSMSYYSHFHFAVEDDDAS